MGPQPFGITGATRARIVGVVEHLVPQLGDHAVRVDDDRVGELDAAVGPQQVALGIAGLGVGDAGALHHRLARLDPFADVHPQHDHLVAELLVQTLERGHLLQARRARGGPEVDDDGAAGEVVERAGLAVEVLEHGRGCGPAFGHRPVDRGSELALDEVLHRRPGRSRRCRRRARSTPRPGARWPASR